MCLAAPLQIIEIEGSEAVAELDGVRRRINVSLIREPQVGGWVLVHAGFAIQKWSQKDVEEYQNIMAEMTALD